MAISITMLTVVMGSHFQLPCNSTLRNFPVLAHYFEHCECVYSNWTEWATPNNAISITVPRNQCDSEMARPEERWQTVISGHECGDNKREERYTCTCISTLHK